MMLNQEHTLAEVLVWNHARHVTVCFLHLSVTWSSRHYISNNARSVHAFSVLGYLFHTRYLCFAAFTFLVPVSIGLLHSHLFDDRKLYMFVDESVGYKCQAAFGSAAFLATIYYIFVPLAEIDAEHTDLTETPKTFRIIGDDYNYENVRTFEPVVEDRGRVTVCFVKS